MAIALFSMVLGFVDDAAGTITLPASSVWREEIKQEGIKGG